MLVGDILWARQGHRTAPAYEKKTICPNGFIAPPAAGERLTVVKANRPCVVLAIALHPVYDSNYTRLQRSEFYVMTDHDIVWMREDFIMQI